MDKVRRAEIDKNTAQQLLCFCEAIWELIESAQIALRTSNTLEREDCKYFQSSQDRQCISF